MLGFKSFETAKRTISGIEIMHMIHKGRMEVVQDVLAEMQFIRDSMAGGSINLLSWLG